jgi:hypothetical protein
MVRLNIRVRPKPAYAYPGNVVLGEFDSATRFEEIKIQLKLDSKSATFYYHGKLCALNSSLASNGVQNGGMIETCSNPLLSATLTAVLNDLNDLRGVEEEDRKDFAEHMTGGAPVASATWDNEGIKKRTICLATMKMILQRDGRFFKEEPVEFAEDLNALYRWIEPVMNQNTNTNANSWNNQCNAFKPTTKKGLGGATTAWLMVEHKLAKQRGADADSADPIEAFVLRESKRHVQKQKAPPKKSTAKCGACGMIGHNRRNYTDKTCAKWAEPEELGTLYTIHYRPYSVRYTPYTAYDVRYTPYATQHRTIHYTHTLIHHTFIHHTEHRRKSASRAGTATTPYHTLPHPTTPYHTLPHPSTLYHPRSSHHLSLPLTTL